MRRAFRKLLGLGITIVVGGVNCHAQNSHHKEIDALRRVRADGLRNSPFSPLALVHREYLDGRTELTIGGGARADIQLVGKDVKDIHATVEFGMGTPRVRATGKAKVERIGDRAANPEQDFFAVERGFRIGRYNLLYRKDAPVRGAALEVYDSADPAFTGFRGLEFFAIDARYRVQAELTPRAEPPQVQLIDSAGQPRPYFIYADLRFTLDGTPVTMEVYSTTLDRAAIARSGFMLIFADATSGKESYYAGRYLNMEGKLSGAVAVDFNLARNPPCTFSPVFTCPFPRAQNRLPVAIRAGEKAYRGKTATPLKQ